MHSPKGFHCIRHEPNYTQYVYDTFPSVHEKHNSQHRKGVYNKYVNTNSAIRNHLSWAVLRKHRIKTIRSNVVISSILFIRYLYVGFLVSYNVTAAMQYG
jgi:hypothetical protein